jgi:hypothetical protein
MPKVYCAEARVRSLRGKFGLSPENVRKIQAAAVQELALYDIQKLVNRQARSIIGMMRTTPIGPPVKDAGLRSADSLLANQQRRFVAHAFELHPGDPISDGVRNPSADGSLFWKTRNLY